MRDFFLFISFFCVYFAIAAFVVMLFWSLCNCREIKEAIQAYKLRKRPEFQTALKVRKEELKAIKQNEKENDPMKRYVEGKCSFNSLGNLERKVLDYEAEKLIKKEEKNVRI